MMMMICFMNPAVTMYSGEAYLVDDRWNARKGEIGVQDISGSFLLSSRR